MTAVLSKASTWLAWTVLARYIIVLASNYALITKPVFELGSGECERWRNERKRMTDLLSD